MATHAIRADLGLDTQLARVGVVVPTYNAEEYWSDFRERLDEQGLSPDQVVIIDSSSHDQTRALARYAGYKVICIPEQEFNHGATRRAACDYIPWAERIVFMTQDAVLASESSLYNLCRALDDPSVGAAYGRQLPREDADPIERHARLFNYPRVSRTNTFASSKEFGFKAAFFSNSFAVYRRSALEEVGSFPSNVIVSEEVTVAARMLLAGWKTEYVADATVIHSHPLSLRQEFSRYFDIGVHHSRERWILDAFGSVSGEGRRYVVDELIYLWRERPSWIPYALGRMASKYIAYKLGRNERFMPLAVRKAISAQPKFWTLSHN